MHPGAGEGPAARGEAGPGSEAAEAHLPMHGRPPGTALLRLHRPQPHGHRLGHLPGAAHVHLPVGHVVHPAAQQALLDEGRCLKCHQKPVPVWLLPPGKPHGDAAL